MYRSVTAQPRRIQEDPSAATPNWRFYTNRQGQWGWCQAEHSGYIVRCSTRFFQFRRDCIHDAEQHGY
ncbi:hypothetical protein [Martelella alba]|uniref:Uncharacterized protein n=1 Tax=Martelella alba TaxID=2590451 RepID=A0ABY2SPC9_9HYPH|nr:hypothetical protein [Martelella alba]TKI07864.1 hypothetical protein FCN80_05360 [Martelella alba]